ncbi:hypothetical protein NODU109028_11945 [Nocardioides dubius]|uniref:DUF3352 domain-containing protein n=1 Tax=Nocardioides dubius TaxID=317019 RepID=A0ABN1TR05_9ACTN
MKFLQTRARRWTLVVVVVALLAAAAGVAWWMWPRPTTLQEAARLLPADMQRVSFTDWAAIRAEQGVDDVSGEAGEALVAEALDAELTNSALAPSSAMLEQGLGLNPLAAQWEVLGQSKAGQVVILRTDESLAAVRTAITELGFSEPDDDATSGGVWQGGPDAIAEVSGLATYELSHLAFLDDEGLLLGSDSPDFLATAVEVAQGDEDGLDQDDLMAAAGEPLTATVLLGEQACGELSMAKADASARAETRRLVEEVGGVSPLTGYLVAIGPGGDLTVGFGFEDDEQAADDKGPRSALAKAEDPGQLLAYPEVFAFDSAEVDGSVLAIRGELQPDAFPLSALAAGPVLLATC